jgi:hypothetical protein
MGPVIIVPKQCTHSVYNTLFLLQLNPCFALPCSCLQVDHGVLVGATSSLVPGRHPAIAAAVEMEAASSCSHTIAAAAHLKHVLIQAAANQQYLQA